MTLPSTPSSARSGLTGGTCICGSDQFDRVASYSRFLHLDGPNEGVIRCRRCGVATRRPSLFDEARRPALARGARLDLVVAAEYSAGNSALPRYLSRRLQRAADEGPRKAVLDVGAGTGTFLMHATAAGWSVTGTELDRESAKRLRTRGIACEIGDVDSISFPDATFGFIHMNHVLEHMQNPRRAIEKALCWLMPGGLLTIEVPNEFAALSQCVQRLLRKRSRSSTTYFQHEWFFTPSSLRRLVATSGFHVISAVTPYRVIPHRPLRTALSTVESALRRGLVIELWARRPR